MKKNKKRLKILFLPAWYPSKKNPVVGVFVKEYAKAVSPYNDIVVIYREGSSRELKRKWKIVSDKNEDGIRTIRFKHKKYYDRITTYFIYLWSIKQLFKKLLEERWKPDIIHAFIYSAGVPAVIVGKKYKIPVVITELYTAIATHSLSTLSKKMMSFAMNRAEAILPISNDLREAIESYYGIKNRFHIIPCVVNIEMFYPPLKRNKCDKKRLLSVGFLTPRKGINYLLQSLSQLKRKRQDYVLDIVGDGPNRKEYEELTRSLSLNGIVEFNGTQPEVASFMRNCDFFVLPSLYENFGVVYIEAMACGKPVIGTTAGGAKEIISKETGILVPPRDIDALTKAVDYMLDHYKDYSPKKILNYVKENFSYKVVGKKINEIYKDILKKKYIEFPTGNSGYKIKIKDDWKVLDVGSGHNPHHGANVILDKYLDNNKERSGKSLKVIPGQKFVKGDACCMPFKNKEFDYIVASNIAEHVENPKHLCKELMRVGKRGYVETPSKFTEKLLGEVFHSWYVYKRDDTLIFERKVKQNQIGSLKRLFYSIYYVNIGRELRPTLYFRNYFLRNITNFLANNFLRRPWRLFKRFTYTCFEWKDKFDFIIINKK